MKHTRPKLKIQKRTLLIILCVLTVISTWSVCGVLGKYTRNAVLGGGIVPNKFYFTSDYLKLPEENAEYTIYGDSVTFNLYNNDGINYTDQNNIRYHKVEHSSGELTEVDVYRRSDGIPQLNQTPAGTTKGSTHTYTLTKGDSDTIEVSVTTSAAYAKTLSATFHFVPLPDGYYHITESDHYIVLDVYTGSVESDGEVNLSIVCKNLAPDNSVPELSDFQRPALDTSVTYSMVLAPNTHYELIFFKMKQFSIDAGEENITIFGDTITLN